QLSGNILYSIVSTSNPLGLAPLGFSANRGAVVMAYLFMQVHVSIAFSTLMQPPFYMAERLILGMHPTPQIVRFGQDTQLDVDLEQDLQEKPYVQCSTPIDHTVSTSSMVEKTEGRMSHLRAALEFGEEITEEQLAAPYSGAKNKLRYITLRLAIITVLVITAVLAQNKFLNLEDFTGATAHTTSCLLMPLIIYLRVFWKDMSVYNKAASMIVIVVCAFTGCYVMIHAGEELFTPSDDDTLFPLERNLFPEFSSETNFVVSDAELSRLPAPLLVWISGFLTVPEFCRVTQTNKYLLQLQDTPELWHQFLLRAYPTARPEGDLKALLY
ncbi:hypothetical protein JM18_008732, partial [Phytophthora kernoviae]